MSLDEGVEVFSDEEVGGGGGGGGGLGQQGEGGEPQPVLVVEEEGFYHCPRETRHQQT